MRCSALAGSAYPTRSKLLSFCENSALSARCVAVDAGEAFGRFGIGHPFTVYRIDVARSFIEPAERLAFGVNFEAFGRVAVGAAQYQFSGAGVAFGGFADQAAHNSLSRFDAFGRWFAQQARQHRAQFGQLLRAACWVAAFAFFPWSFQVLWVWHLVGVRFGVRSVY